MTVQELIEELQAMPSHMRVVCPGYEGGYADVLHPRMIAIKLNVNDEWYYGPHEEADGGHGIPAILIPR